MSTERLVTEPLKQASLIITYGCGSNLQGCYSRVTGKTIKEVREKIAKVTEGKYSFSYAEDEASEDMIKTWSLKEVALQPMYPTGGQY